MTAASMSRASEAQDFCLFVEAAMQVTYEQTTLANSHAAKKQENYFEHNQASPVLS